jgi:hypothetical protein
MSLAKIRFSTDGAAFFGPKTSRSDASVGNAGDIYEISWLRCGRTCCRRHGSCSLDVTGCCQTIQRVQATQWGSERVSAAEEADPKKEPVSLSRLGMNLEQWSLAVLGPEICAGCDARRGEYELCTPTPFARKCIDRSDTNILNLALAIAGICTPSKPK